MNIILLGGGFKVAPPVDLGEITTRPRLYYAVVPVPDTGPVVIVRVNDARVWHETPFSRIEDALALVDGSLGLYQLLPALLGHPVTFTQHETSPIGGEDESDG